MDGKIVLPESAGLAQAQRGCDLVDGSCSLENRNQLNGVSGYDLEDFRAMLNTLVPLQYQGEKRSGMRIERNQ